VSVKNLVGKSGLKLFVVSCTE